MGVAEPLAGRDDGGREGEEVEEGAEEGGELVVGLGHVVERDRRVLRD